MSVVASGLTTFSRPGIVATARGWVHRPRPNPMARARFYGFAYAGSGASLFHAWGAALPPEVETCAIAPPGREWRADEPAPATLQAWIDGAAAGIRSEAGLPYVLFGHSLGALVAHEVAHALVTAGGAPPALLVVSARRPPWVEDGEPLLAPLDDDAFVAEIRRRFGGLPELVLQHPELLAHALPMLRADIALMEAHPWARHAPLSCPVLALAGATDGFADVRLMRRWREATTGPFGVDVLPGGHFFVNDSRDRLLATLAPSLRRVAGLG